MQVRDELRKANIKEFFYIFGTQTTTNHDSMRYAKMLKIKNFHVVMSDEVKELPENSFSAILIFNCLQRMVNIGLVCTKEIQTKGMMNEVIMKLLLFRFLWYTCSITSN